MNKKAILEVKAGLSVKEVADDYNLKESTLRKWVREYVRPDANLIKDLLAEAVVDILQGGAKGSDLNGVVAALKLVEQPTLVVLDDEDDDTYEDLLAEEDPMSV